MPRTPTTVRQTRKKALSVAIGYHKLSAKYPDYKVALPYTNKDPPKLVELLTTAYGYDEKDITILSDDPEHPDKYTEPTRENILNAIDDLVRGAEKGDHLVFHFSGHGCQVVNLDGTEEDGFDEVILPVDAILDIDAPRNYIKDDTLKIMLVDSLPEGVRMTAIFDCCHCGTALDLPQTYIHKNPAHALPPKSTPTSTNQKRTFFRLSPGVAHAGAQLLLHAGKLGLPFRAKTKAFRDKALITSWSGCLDDEVGLETEHGGAFTQALKDIILNHLRKHRNRPLTNLQVLESLSQELYDVAIRRKWENRSTPVLSGLVESCHLFDQPFIL